MKKKNYVFLAATVLIMLTFTACGANSEDPCTDCNVDSVVVKDSLGLKDSMPSVDTPLSPIDSAGSKANNVQ